MAAQSIEGANLIGAFLSAAAFGVYTCLFVQTLYRLTRTPVRPILLSINLTILWSIVLATTVIQISSIYHAFITLNGTVDANQYYRQWYRRSQSTARSVLTQTAGLLGNSFFCWRLYVMWKRSQKVLIVSGVFLLGLVVCLTMAAFYATKALKETQYDTLRSTWNLAFIGLGFTVNVLVIVLMCLRVWMVSKFETSINVFSAPFYHHVLHILIESGALFAVTVLLSLAMKGANLTSARIIFTYIIPHVIGISPTLLVLRIASSAQISPGASGHDTPPPTSQRESVSRAVFAPSAGDNGTTMTRMSEMQYAVQLSPSTTVKDKILSPKFDVADAADSSNTSSKSYGSGLDA